MNQKRPCAGRTLTSIINTKFKIKTKASKGSNAGAMLLCLFGAAGAAKAQSVLMAPPSLYSTTPPAVQAQSDAELGSTREGGKNPALPDFTDLMHWGPVTLRPHATYQVTYGTGLQSAPGQQQASLVQTFSPGVLLNLGTHWTLDYTPSFTYYSNTQFHDTVNQNASLSWATFYDDWSLSFSQSFSMADTPLIETGTQTSTESYNTSLSASHRLNSLLSLDMGVSQSIMLASQFTSSDSWSTMEWLNYQFWPRLDGALGAGFGYDKVSAGSDMTHETAQARLSWRAGNKLSLDVHGGLEDRQYLGGGIPNSINPLYGVALQYQAFEQTSFSLSAERTITTSLFVNQATESSSLNVGLSQRLLKHLNLSLSGTYGITDYIASDASVAAGRSDSYYSISSGLSWLFLKRATASLSYQYSVNSSSTTGFSFASSQYGFQLGYAF